VIRRGRLGSGERLIAGSLRIEPFEGRRRVCGGRGQFGKALLWDLNTIFELWIECRSREASKSDQLRKSFEDWMHVQAVNM
jgi:hypothetical protein